MAYTKYSLTPSSNNAAPPDGAPEGMLPSAVNDTMRDMMAQIRDCGDGIRGGTYTMTAPVITGGSINGTPIGASTANTGAFSTLSYTGTLTGGTGVVNLGSGQFYKDASGNVGVGTSSPNNKLQVLGTIKVATGNAQGILGLGDGAGSTVNCGVWRGAANAPTSDGNYLNFGGYDGLVFATGNAAIGSQTERMRIDSSGNVGIGNSSPIATANQTSLQINGTNAGNIWLTNATSGSSVNNGLLIQQSGLDTYFYNYEAGLMAFATSNAERMRIDSSGNLRIGTTVDNDTRMAVYWTQGSPTWGAKYLANNSGSTNFIEFRVNMTGGGSTVGSITYNGTLTVYATTSDYRLKTVIAPVVDAGTRIDALQPIEYDWKSGGRTRGFLAHQFAEVYPSSVSGEKDAVDEEGKPVYQSMQASTPEVMADLIAEIQSLRKRVAQLESK